jgi:hypothetical protein
MMSNESCSWPEIGRAEKVHSFAVNSLGTGGIPEDRKLAARNRLVDRGGNQGKEDATHEGVQKKRCGTMPQLMTP